MSYISDKIAEVRGQGFVVPAGIEELFLAIETEIGLDEKQKKPAEKFEPATQFEPKQPNTLDAPKQYEQPNPLDGERLKT